MVKNETIRLAMPGGEITIPPPPCGWCQHVKTCETERMACATFYAYVSGVTKIGGKKKPSAEWGDVVFSTNDDGRNNQMLVHRAMMRDRGHPTDLDGIRKSHAEGKSMRQIARDYGVSESRIWRMFKGDRNASQG